MLLYQYTLYIETPTPHLFYSQQIELQYFFRQIIDYRILKIYISETMALSLLWIGLVASWLWIVDGGAWSFRTTQYSVFRIPYSHSTNPVFPKQNVIDEQVFLTH